MFRDIQLIPSFVELQCSAEEVLFVLSLAKERRDCPGVRRLLHMLSSSAVKTRGFSRKSPRYGAIAPRFQTETRNQCAMPCHAAEGAGGCWLVLVRRAQISREEEGDCGGGIQKIPRTAMGGSGDEGGERAISDCRPWRGDCRSRLCRA